MAQSISIITPLIYVFVVITSLIIFSSVYRKRKICKWFSCNPWISQLLTVSVLT